MLSYRMFLLFRVYFLIASRSGVVPCDWSTKHQLVIPSETASKRARFANLYILAFISFKLFQLLRFYVQEDSENFNITILHVFAYTISWMAHAVMTLQKDSVRMVFNAFTFYLHHMNSKFPFKLC